MIYVKRNQEESSQKVISTFLKRVKKSNLVNRKRKTQFATKPISDLEKKRKAIRSAEYAVKQSILARTAK
jgi:GMP synthase PP-ATPase subunit